MFSNDTNMMKNGPGWSGLVFVYRLFAVLPVFVAWLLSHSSEEIDGLSSSCFVLLTVGQLDSDLSLFLWASSSTVLVPNCNTH